MIFLFLE